MTFLATIGDNGAAITMTSLELVEFINSQRAPGEAELRHDHFMVKVPKVLGVDLAPKFLGTSFYVNGAGNSVPRAIYRFPKREAESIAALKRAGGMVLTHTRLDAEAAANYAALMASKRWPTKQAMVAEALALLAKKHKAR